MNAKFSQLAAAVAAMTLLGGASLFAGDVVTTETSVAPVAPVAPSVTTTQTVTPTAPVVEQSSSSTTTTVEGRPSHAERHLEKEIRHDEKKEARDAAKAGE